eukprot:563740-Alexandrium_andersonii.AAC.1
MSASLVGSEMCIRDSSLLGAPGGHSNDDRLNRLRKFRPDYERTDHARGCCLLYTSDAADDM